MNEDVLKVNMLSIAVAGFLILLTGVILYIFRDQVYDNVRYFMPLPPIGVAAYIFVFNMYRHYDGTLSGGSWGAAKEILISTAIAAAAFGVFTFLLVFIIDILKR
jgi:hypothetical protein